MKKLLQLVVILLMMSLAAQSVYAQNETLSTEQPDEVVLSADTAKGDSPAVSDQQTLKAVQPVIAMMNVNAGDQKQNMLGKVPPTTVPYFKHRKIDGHHMCHSINLSLLVDKSESSFDIANNLFGGVLSGGGSDAADEMSEHMENKTGGLGFGANFAYSFIFIPGYKVEGKDELQLNRFGFGYEVGFITQFDHEKNAGLTWDFLGKVGLLAGFNQAIGVNVDFLFGGGKTAQTVVDFGAVDFQDPDPDDLDISTESLWCAKLGTQLSLNKSINNFDIALFTRFVYSVRPYSEKDYLHRIEIDSECAVWQYEAWSVGLSVIYYIGGSSRNVSNIPFDPKMLDQSLPW